MSRGRREGVRGRASKADLAEREQAERGRSPVGSEVARKRAQGAAAEGSDSLTGRPGEVHEREGEARVEAHRLRALQEAGHRGDPEDAVGESGDDDDRAERVAAVQQRRKKGHGGRPERRDADEDLELRRSASLPTTGLSADSAPADSRNTALIPTTPAPSACRRSGASTLRRPKRSAGNATSHIPPRSRGCRKWAARFAIVCGASGRPTGASAAAIAITTPTAATALNTGRVPKEAAAPPTSGPISAPAIPAARADPISSPRRSRGALDTSHASDPVHVHAPPKPWQKRAASKTRTH